MQHKNWRDIAVEIFFDALPLVLVAVMALSACAWWSAEMNAIKIAAFEREFGLTLPAKTTVLYDERETAFASPQTTYRCCGYQLRPQDMPLLLAQQDRLQYWQPLPLSAKRQQAFAPAAGPLLGLSAAVPLPWTAEQGYYMLRTSKAAAHDRLKAAGQPAVEVTEPLPEQVLADQAFALIDTVRCQVWMLARTG